MIPGLKVILLTSALVASVLLLSSCYHLGIEAETRAVTIGEVVNTTLEPSITPALRASLSEQFRTRPPFTTATQNTRFILNATATKINTSNLARAELRGKKSRDDDTNAYQSVLRQLKLTVDFTVIEKDTNKTLLTDTVTGIANIPRMHDRNVPLQNACRTAANDAARQIAEILADNDWRNIPPATAK